jgi:hypothetical protein
VKLLTGSSLAGSRQMSSIGDMLDVVNVEGETFTTAQAETYREMSARLTRAAYREALTDMLNFRDHFTNSEKGFMLVHDYLAARAGLVESGTE